jgi:hypothetical protein
MQKKPLKLLAVLIIGIYICASWVNPALAAALATGEATTYYCTIIKFELYNGSEWIVVYEGTSAASINIAAANSGETAGNFLSGISVPDGTYSRARATPSGTFTIGGSISYSGSTYRTNGSVNVTTGGSKTSTSGNVVATTITISGVTATENTLSPAITIKDGTPDHKVRVSFDVSSGIGLYASGPTTYDIFPEIPTVSMSIQ